jgi:hypothetical protein
MYYLQEIFPPMRRLRIPLTRDQVMMFMIALNELLLGFETYSAHIISGTIRPNEWIPIIFGPTAGILLLLAGLISIRKRSAAMLLAGSVLASSFIVGALGAYFHGSRAFLQYAPAGERITTAFIIWAPPILAPLTFCLVAILGLGAILQEEPADSGRLKITDHLRLHLPVNKSQFYFLLTGLGILATVTSSILDHARTDFTNPWLWLPTGIGVFSCVVAIGLGFLRKPGKGDLAIYFASMSAMIFTGLLGSYLHIRQDLTASGIVVLERFIRGAPVLAPMLFADMGAIGFIALLEPLVRAKDQPQPIE